MTEEERKLIISYLEDMKEEYVEGEGNERYPLPEWYMLDKVIKIIEQQPSENEELIKVSKGAVKARTGRFVIYDVKWLKEHFNTTEAKIYGQPHEDCISRAEAIKALEYELSIEADGGLDKYRTVIKDLVNAIYNTQKKAIEDLPSIQSQPKERTETHARDCVSRKGHWITQWNVTHQKEYYYCSECREEFSYDGETGIKMNDYSYCPNCGSCNRGRKE